jgi:hypothetical protein
MQVMKDKFDFIEKRFGRMMDAWEIMGQNWERREKERRGGEKESSSASSSSSILESIESMDRIVDDSIKRDTKKVRELRKELHS